MSLSHDVVVDRLDPAYLDVEIARWHEERQLLEADMLAGDFSRWGPDELLGGIHYADAVLRQLVKQVERVTRAELYRRDPTEASDLAQRFAAARHVDMETAVQAVTGQWATDRHGKGRLWMTCPLPGHDERTPSFSFHPDGRWYCFGCHRGGGDAASFAAAFMGAGQYEGLRLIEEIFGLWQDSGRTPTPTTAPLQRGNSGGSKSSPPARERSTPSGRHADTGPGSLA